LNDDGSVFARVLSAQRLECATYLKYWELGVIPEGIWNPRMFDYEWDLISSLDVAD
jgi:hypothetical protein